MQCNLFKGILGLSLFVVASAASAQVATMPPQSGTFTGNTRGYWFTAPVSFVMTGVKVLRQDGNTSATVQNFAVVRYHGGNPPPTFPATTNAFDQLALGLGQTPDVFIGVNLTINAGDVIGMYGNMAVSDTATSGLNSYGNGALGTTIFGNAVTLNRSGMQFHLGSATSPGGMHDTWWEGTGGGNITRIEFTYQAVPEPATMAALGLGLVAVIRRRRRA